MDKTANIMSAVFLWENYIENTADFEIIMQPDCRYIRLM